MTIIGGGIELNSSLSSSLVVVEVALVVVVVDAAMFGATTFASFSCVNMVFFLKLIADESLAEL